MARWLVILLIVIFTFFALIAGYYGAFNSIKFEKKTLPSMLLVYEKHQGNYKEIGRVMDKVFYKLLKEDLKVYTGFGAYYDDPKRVDETKLRSIAGGIILNYDDNLTSTLEKRKLNIGTVESGDAIVTEFPLKGVGSILFAVMRVYPKIKEYQKEYKLEDRAVMEIYDYQNQKIQFILFNKKTDDKLKSFYVK